MHTKKAKASKNKTNVQANPSNLIVNKSYKKMAKQNLYKS